MRIYLATTTSGLTKEQRKEVIKCCRPLYLLETFCSGEKRCAMVQNDVGTDNFLLDSGAFSYMNGKTITEKQMEEYIEKYICHIKKYNVKYFFEMDVDCIFGLEKVEIWRKKIENQTGIKSIPVWHKSRGIDYFKQMVNEYDYIAIGGFANGDIKKTEYPLINKMVKYANARGTKVHGLGFTQMKHIYDYPFYSVDSSTWCTGVVRGGYLYYFDGKVMKYDIIKNGKKLNLSKMAMRSFSEWVKFQKYLNTRRVV